MLLGKRSSMKVINTFQSEFTIVIYKPGIDVAIFDL